MRQKVTKNILVVMLVLKNAQLQQHMLQNLMLLMQHVQQNVVNYYHGLELKLLFQINQI